MFTGFHRAGVAAATGLLAITLASAGAAQEFPSRPVRLVIGFAPGGIADISSRLLAQALAEKMGQPFIIDNRPGAGGIVSAEQVAKAAPDGYNLLLMTNGNAAAVTLMKSLPYDPVKDFAMISPYSTFDLVIVTGRESKIITLKDLLNAARINPQKFNLGSINIGSTQHLSLELFRAQAGIEMKAVTQRISSSGAPFDDAIPHARALVEAAPERVLWGTDFPHPNISGDMPNDGELVNLFARTIVDETLRTRILVDNPKRLYWAD